MRKHRIRYAQRGDYACLVDMAGSRDRHDTGVALHLLDLPMHKQHRENNQTPHMLHKCNAQTHDGMTNLMYPNSFEHDQQVKWGPHYIICIIRNNPILKLSDSSATKGTLW